MSRIMIEPIGVVRSPIVSVSHTEWSDVVSEIHIDPSFQDGLLGLSAYPQIQIIFYLDLAAFNPATDMTRHPRDRKDIPVRGVFATRTQYRPNTIGVTVVTLLGISGRVLTVKGLDALDGTPVLDIKSFES